MRTQARGRLRLAPYFAALAIAATAAAPAAAQETTPAPATAEMKDLPLTAEQRQAYVGVYSVAMPEGTMNFRVYEQAGALFGAPGDDEPKRLLYQGENLFRPEGMPEFSVAFTMEGSRAAKFVVKSPEFTLEGIRVP
jgi:hypothetical protein